MWDIITKYYGIDWTAMVLNALAIYLLGQETETRILSRRLG